jgi:hypothetical protein
MHNETVDAARVEDVFTLENRARGADRFPADAAPRRGRAAVAMQHLLFPFRRFTFIL